VLIQKKGEAKLIKSPNQSYFEILRKSLKRPIQQPRGERKTVTLRGNKGKADSGNDEETRVKRQDITISAPPLRLMTGWLWDHDPARLPLSC
jgi:hypothetical protein